MEIASVICRSYCARANRHTRPVAKFHSKFMHRASIPFAEFREMNEPINAGCKWKNMRENARTRLVFSRDNLRREREEEVRIKSRKNMAITRRLILKFVWWRKYVAAKGGGVVRATKEGANLLEPGQNALPAGCKPLGLVMIQSSVKPAAAGLDRVAHVNCTIRGVTFSGYVYPRNPTSTVHLPAPRPLN